MIENQQHWYIIGAGAIGCLWAYALKQAGQDVTLVVRARDAKAIKASRSNLQRVSVLSTANGLNHIDVNTITAPELTGQKTVVKHCIIATKAYDANSALEAITPALSTSATVLSLCNGMGMHKTMQQQLKSHSKQIQFLLGVTSDGALLQQAFQLTHTGIGHTFIGHYLEQEQQQKHHQPSNSLLPPNFYLQHSIVSNIHAALWQKMLINCVINPLTLIYQCKNGELFNKNNHAEIQALCDELSCIANTPSITHGEYSISAATLFEAAKKVAAQTAHNTSSMLKDAQLGRPLELEYINGYLVKLAQDNGIACPINEQLLSKLL